MAETALYPTVKRFLEGAGFSVKGEVCGCDIVAVREGAPLLLAIVELKRGFNLELLLQAVDRMRPADEVWVAVPLTRRGRDRDPRVRRLCRLIGLGLMAVDAAHGRVEILAEPGPYKPRSRSAAADPPAYRAFAPPGRSHAGRLNPRAGDDGLSPTRTRLRRWFARRGRPAARFARRCRRCRPNSTAQRLWLVRAHCTRPLPSHTHWRSGAATLAQNSS